MVVVKIHGMNLATCTQRVIIACNELGLKYEIVPVDILKGAHKQPEYIENWHPFGVIPVLEDEDGTKIYESRAIARYLTAKYGKGNTILPSPINFKEYGLFEQAASIEYSSFDPSASGFVKERVFSKMFGREPDEAAAAKYEETLKAKLEGYERILSKQKYLAGDYVTLADLFHLPYGHFLNQADPSIFGSRPNIKRWWDDITSRESWMALQRELLTK